MATKEKARVSSAGLGPTSKGSPSIKHAQRFVAALAGGEPVTFQTFDDNKEHKKRSLTRVLHGTLDEHAAELASLNEKGTGVFVMVNQGDGRGRNASSVRRVRALFADFDNAAENPLEKLKAAPVKPHVVVETSWPGR
jgi:hypothetical protein